jgi:3-hydroxyisobutyrate dehydrogenase-like beta-hydroxyacid dehydrogenase
MEGADAMTPVVAIIAPGNMGSAVGARLTEKGVRVLTSLEGRSAASTERAKTAGMIAASDPEIAAADVILSIVPPGEALPLAQRLAAALSAANKKPVYADCNAVNPDTVSKIATVIAQTGCMFVDAGIIGGPPRAGYNGPVFYVSGENTDKVEPLNGYGLVIRKVNGAIGAASALKMSFGGITKGLIAIGSAMTLAAHRAGVADALEAELASSQPNTLATLKRMVPDMPPKAYRWVAEMEEIAGFTGSDAEREMYLAIAKFYERLSRDGAEDDIAALGKSFPKAKPN